MKLQTHDLIFFLGKRFFGDDGFKKMFVYQATRDTLELKKDKGTDYVLSWKSKGCILLHLRHYTLLSCIVYIFQDIEWE